MMGVPGHVGLQGAQGPPGPEKIRYTRYISSGGLRVVYDEDSVIVVDTEETVTFVLPERHLEKGDDFYYETKRIEIYVLKGRHRVTTKKRINTFMKTVELDYRMAKYEFVMVPSGWTMMIFESQK